MRVLRNSYVSLLAWGILLAGTSSLTSCAEDEVINNYGNKEDGAGISFSLSKDNNVWEADSRAAQPKQNFVLRSEDSADTLCVSAQTEYGISDALLADSRGALVTNKDNVLSFGVTSYFYTSTEETAPAFYYMKNEEVEDGQTTKNKAYYWPPSNNELSFVAVAPYHELTLPDSPTASATLSYTVPTDVAKHEDLMVARTVKMNNGTGNGQVPLSFNHILASVQFAFVTADIEETPIKSISISGPLSQEGTYTVGTSSEVSQEDGTTKVVYDGGIWANKAATDVTYSIVPTEGQAAIATTTSTTDNTKTIVTDKIITLPQRFAADKVTLTIVLDDGTTSGRTVSGSIPAGNWVQGTITTYTISITPAYTLEFTEYEEVLDAHYIITKIKFKTDVNWTMSVPDNAAGWAYLSKEKSNQGTDSSNKENEITTGQLAGKWSYVQKCNKQTINGTVKQEGVVENVMVYMLLRENTTTQNRKFNVYLSKQGDANIKGQQFTQLTYKIIDGFAMERIEDDSSPFGFAKNIGEVTYKYKSGSGIMAWLISSLVNGWTGFLSFVPDDMTITLTTNVTNIADPNSGLTNTNNASSVTITGDQGFLIEQGWYTTNANIDIDDIKTAIQKCISKNTYGDYTGTKDDTDAPDIPTNIVWYLPAINEMLKIEEQDTETGANQYTGSSESYWSSTAINDQNLQAYSWYFEAGTGVATARSTNLKVRCARTIATN